MKPTNKKVEALALRYTPWVIARYSPRQELFLDSEQLLDTNGPHYIITIHSFSTRREAKEYLANMIKYTGVEYKIVKLAVVL